MKKLLTLALVLALVAAMAVPAMATTVAMKNLRMDITQDYEVFVGDDATISVVVTSTSGANRGTLIVGEETRNFSLKNRESATFSFEVACYEVGEQRISVTLNETNGSGKINETRNTDITITVKPEWVVISADPTCTLEGYTADYNQKTGWKGNYVYTAPLGHAWVGVATWDGHGWWSGACERCEWQGYLSYKPQNGTVEPTCTLEGYDFTYDFNSDQYWYANYVPALGHVYDGYRWDGHGWLILCKVCDWGGYVSFNYCDYADDCDCPICIPHVCDQDLSVTVSSRNLQNSSRVTFTVVKACNGCGAELINESATYNVGQSAGTRSYDVFGFTVTIVVNQNNMITSVTVA